MSMLTYSLTFLLLIVPATTKSYEVPNGVTVYNQELAYLGYTLVASEIDVVPETLLIDIYGSVVHKWNVAGEAISVLPGGNLLGINRSHPGRRLEEWDWDDNIIWSYDPKDLPHHDFRKLENGNYMFLVQEEVPAKILSQLDCQGLFVPERADELFSDYIMEVDPQGGIIWEWHAYNYFDVNTEYRPRCPHSDWFHTNSIEVLPPNALDQDPRFRAGNILVSFRNIDTIAIIDKESKEIVWRWGKGILSHQHAPSMLPNGHILVYDNGLHSLKPALQTYSRILEVDPATQNIVWFYQTPMPHDFFSPNTGSVQKLPNGNLLTVETRESRIFEITPGGQVVWEFIRPTRKRGAVSTVPNVCPTTGVHRCLTPLGIKSKLQSFGVKCALCLDK